MVDRGVWLVPTIAVSRCEEFFAKIGAPEWMVRKALAAGIGTSTALRTAIRSGVEIALGTDMMPGRAVRGHDRDHARAGVLRRGGHDSAAGVRVATMQPARWLGVADNRARSRRASWRT